VEILRCFFLNSKILLLEYYQGKYPTNNYLLINEYFNYDKERVLSESLPFACTISFFVSVARNCYY
jgi:hypothetical protein